MILLDSPWGLASPRGFLSLREPISWSSSLSALPLVSVLLPVAVPVAGLHPLPHRFHQVTNPLEASATSRDGLTFRSSCGIDYRSYLRVPFCSLLFVILGFHFVIKVQGCYMKFVIKVTRLLHEDHHRCPF